MASRMVTPEFQRINLDYNRKMAELQRQKESAEKDEYSRMAKRYDEANLAAKAIEEDKRSSSANTDCSESEQETTLQRESQEPSTSTSSNLSFERKEETEITFKRFIEPPQRWSEGKKTIIGPCQTTYPTIRRQQRSAHDIKLFEKRYKHITGR